MSDDYKLTSTQIGAIGENVVATELILQSNGRLSPFIPMADDKGIDLLIYDKETGGALPLQVKSRTKTNKKNPKTVYFETRRAVFNENQDAYLLAVLFDDSNSMNVERAWFIPMRELSNIANIRPDKLVINPSKDMKAKDRYTPYRCEGMKNVAERLIEEFDRLHKSRRRKKK